MKRVKNICKAIANYSAASQTQINGSDTIRYVNMHKNNTANIKRLSKNIHDVQCSAKKLSHAARMSIKFDVYARGDISRQIKQRTTLNCFRSFEK